MKRNINLIILTFEIAAIVVLHAVKIGQSEQQPQEKYVKQIVSKKIVPQVSASSPLLSIK